MIELVLVMLWAGAILWLFIILLTTWAVLRPPRLTPARAMARLRRMSPSDIGLHQFEERQFVARTNKGQELAIAAWWIEAPAKSDVTAVIIHGYADSRAGALAWAPVWLEAGCNTLLIDLPAHGESGGTYITAGLRERHLLEQVIDQIRSESPDQSHDILLFGVSMGAAVALATADVSADIAGVVIDSPVADFYHGAAIQLWLMGLPGKVILRPGLWLAEAIIGDRFASIRPAAVVPRLNCPVLALAPTDDPFLPPAAAQELAEAIQLRRREDQISHWVTFIGAAHLQPLQFNAAEYKEALHRFCNACKSNRLARAAARERFGVSRPPAPAGPN